MREAGKKGRENEGKNKRRGKKEQEKVEETGREIGRTGCRRGGEVKGRMDRGTVRQTVDGYSQGEHRCWGFKRPLVACSPSKRRVEE